MNFFKTAGNTPITFTQDNAGGLIPGHTGQLSAAQLANLNANDFNWQAAPDGSQTSLQSLLFNQPTFNADGTAVSGGLNLDGIGSVMSGIGNFAQIATALKQIGVAKDQLSFQKQAYNTNLANQTQSYNTALEGRTRARFHTEGRSAADVDAYLAKHSL